MASKRGVLERKQSLDLREMLVNTIFACFFFTVSDYMLAGYKVSDTIRKGIVDVSPYNNSEKLLLMGNLSALTGEPYQD